MRFPFKSVFVAGLATFGAFAAVVYSSCNRDKCKTIVCANGGVCNDGACTCPSGYEGTNCEKASRDKFVGNWNVFEKGSITLPAQYPVSVEPALLTSDVVIKNLYNYFRTPIRATVQGDRIIIPNQQYEGKIVFGRGQIFSSVTYGQYGRIEMRYSVIDTATQKVNDFGYNEPVNLSSPSEWSK